MEYVVKDLKQAASIQTVTFDKEDHFIGKTKFIEISD